MKDLSYYRKSYDKSELLENTIPDDAIQLFHNWFYEAEEQENGEVNAMTVSSIGLDGFPKSRVVLLKKFNEEVLYFTPIIIQKREKPYYNIQMFVFLSFGRY
jgi:pyridoxamine 5'-phosphate oxidase